MAFEADRVLKALERLRADTPRVHCITNGVAQGFTANVLLALGAVPSMTLSPEEIQDFVWGADALLVNLGTLDEERRRSIPLAMEAARAAGRPCVVDPVFVNRSRLRCAYARELLQQGPSIVKVNQAEHKALFPLHDPQTTDLPNDSTLIVTGLQDRVERGQECLVLENGSPLFARVTATGCAAGACLAAFAAVEENPLYAAAAALSVFNIAGELAGQKSEGPGSFVPAFLDALHNLSGKDIDERLKATTETSRRVS